MRTSSSDTEAYNSIVRNAVNDDAIFAVFKRQKDYTKILEHVSYELGEKYLQIIKRDNPDLIKKMDKFKKNDLFGNPDVYYYEGIGNISPTTVRYIKVLSDILKMDIDLSGKDIVEIGPGYGGQCLILSIYFKFKSYLIIDIPGPLALAKKYLKLHNVKNVFYKEMDQLQEHANYYFSLSNYAFSECNKSIQDTYIKRIFDNSEHGYVTMNYHGNLLKIGAYTKEYILNILNYVISEKEEPLTSKDNEILKW